MSELTLPVSLSAQFEQLRATIVNAFELGQLEKLVLSKYKGSESGLEKIQIRLVDIKQLPMLSLVYKYQTKDITKNYNLPEALDEIAAQLDQGFKHLHVNTITHDYQLMVSKKAKVVLAKQPSSKLQSDLTDKRQDELQNKSTANTQNSAEHLTKQNHQQNSNSSTDATATNTPSTNPSPDSIEPTSVSTMHNRVKHRYIEQARPFLQQLGVTDTQGQIIPAMSRKWKQINKFLEIFAGALEQAKLQDQDTLSVVDFGSGKGYLTFAVHDYIVQQLQKSAEVTGVELRDELVEFCNDVAQKVDAKGMTFYQGDVRSFTPNHVDVMIALHACDVATDYALHTGIRLNAAVIMCAPCCHKEIRPQLKMPTLLQPMLQYGVHLGQQAEMLTDSMRALLLEAHGYETKVFEFVSLEHTSKNKMILAIKKQSSTKNQTEIMQKVQALKAFYGIEQQSLETLLK